jgi:5-methylcytosine-specific restriction protein A
MKRPRLTTLRSRVPTASSRIEARPRQVDAYYSTPEHRAWRLAVCRAAGWRCEAIENGQRCVKSAASGDRMFADHVAERSDGGPDHGLGMCICGQHHTEKTNRERAKRMAIRW